MATTTAVGSDVDLAGYPELRGSLSGGSTELWGSLSVYVWEGVLRSSHCPIEFHSFDHPFFVISLSQRAERSDCGPLRSSQTGWSRADLEQAVGQRQDWGLRATKRESQKLSHILLRCPEVPVKNL